ncbi:C4-type Zn-finger protein [Sporosarcina psychrophila]|uniref:C4-type Zn-finger protein n=1 Tax=Sporosarcina psychrophila TaxID=1476 RepID=A0ABV2KC77_SPOPS
MKNGRDSGLIYWKLNYRKKFIIYVELKNPAKFTMAINKERVLIRGVDYRTLSALGMPLAVSLD